MVGIKRRNINVVGLRYSLGLIPNPTYSVDAAGLSTQTLIGIAGGSPTGIILQRARLEYVQPPERDHPVRHFWQKQNPDHPWNPSAPNEYACAVLQGRRSLNQYAVPERLFSMHSQACD